MIRFKVIDITTGREVSSDKIDKIAKENELMDMDIDQFYIGEDGTLVLADDCGKTAYCDIEKLGFMPVLIKELGMSVTTNGDVIKALFPDYKTEIDFEQVICFKDDNNWISSHPDWWNAPYKAEMIGEVNCN